MNKTLIHFPWCKSLGFALLLLFFGGVSGYADELDTYLAGKKQSCERHTRELEEKKQQLQAAQGQASGQAAVEIQQHLLATQQALDQMHAVLAQAPPQTAAEKQTYARALAVAEAQVSTAKR